MQTSILIAQILGPILVVISLGLIFTPKHYLKLYAEMTDMDYYFGGIIAMVVGLLLTLNHNIWEGNWTVLITVLGWLALIKGICLLLFPKWVRSIRISMKFSHKTLVVVGIIYLIITAILTYNGYLA